MKNRQELMMMEVVTLYTCTICGAQDVGRKPPGPPGLDEDGSEIEEFLLPQGWTVGLGIFCSGECAMAMDAYAADPGNRVAVTDTCTQIRGTGVLPPAQVKVIIEVPLALAQRLDVAALKDNRTRLSMIRLLIERGLEGK